MQKVVIGSDHVGFPLKLAAIQYLTSRGVEVKDMGTDSESVVVDYPDYAQKVAWAVTSGEYDSGIVMCGTGIGVSVAANKVPGARAALCFDTFTAHQARAHNNANILAMGAWVVTPQRACGMLDEWIKTDFEAGRHVHRVERLNQGVNNLNTLDPYHFGISISFRPTSFAPVLFSGKWEEGLRSVATQGLHAVEFSIRNVEDISVEKLIELLSRYDLTVSALATSQGCIEDGLCLAASEADVRRLAIERMQSLSRLAAQLGAALIIGGVRGRLSAHPEKRQEQRAQAIDAFKEVVDYASNIGVTCLLEPINRFETNFVNTISEGLAILDEVGNPNFKLLADTFHMNIEEADINQSLREAGPRVGYVHFADSNRRAPGWGHIDFSSVFQTLQSIDYSGRITAEILPSPNDLAALEQASHFYANKCKTLGL